MDFSGDLILRKWREAGERRPRDEELHNVYASPNTVRAIKTSQVKSNSGSCYVGPCHHGMARHGTSLDCRWRRRPPDVEDTCECIE
jgi:hypothetical protein